MDNYFDQFEQELQEKPIDWREIFERNNISFKWIIFSIITALFLGAVYVRMQNDVYELKSSVLIIDQARNGQMNEMSVLKQLDAVGMGGGRSTSMVNNEEQVLKSTALMKRVVNELELYTTYTHREFLKTEELYTTCPIYVGIDSSSLAQLKSVLTLSIQHEDGQLFIQGKYKESNFTLRADKLPATLKTPAGNVTFKLRDGKTFPDETIKVNINVPTKVAKSLSERALSTEVGKMVDVIDLTLQASSIQKGQDILNTLAAIYNQDASEQNNLSAINTAKFIDVRLKLLAKELSDVESDIESYKRTNKLTDIDEDAKLFLKKNDVYDQQQIEVEIQQHLIKYVEEFIHNPANSKALIPNLGLKDIGLVAVIQKYNELVMNRERIARGSSEENPGLITLNQEISTTRKAIQTSIANTKKGLQISNTDLTSQNLMMQSKIREIPRQEREFIEIKRQQQVKESLYLFLLHKREEASLNMAITVPKGRILNTPDDGVKVGPRTLPIMLIFLALGLFIPFIYILIKNLLNTTLTSRSQIEKLTKVAILAELGHNTTGDIIIDHKATNNVNAELFRLLRTKLQFVLDYPSQKVVMVTSTEPGEGKTYVSINLAITLSLTDKKVLLIGLDLRKPQLANHFKFNAPIGVTSYLSGSESDCKPFIHSLKNYPFLDILPAGAIPPDPNELLLKKRLDTLIAELKETYDYIIIDTAPVGAVSDSLIVNRLVDVNLYVCRAGYSDIRNMEFLNHIKTEGTLTRPYLLINDIDLESKYYYQRGYHYGYGHKYGYNYGYDDEKKGKVKS